MWEPFRRLGLAIPIDEDLVQYAQVAPPCHRYTGRWQASWTIARIMLIACWRVSVK